jgi:hypothetical protein
MRKLFVRPAFALAQRVHDGVFRAYEGAAMRKIAKIAIFGPMLALAGCAAFRPAPNVGDPESVVVQKLGQPNAVYPEPNGGRELEYTLQPMGQQAFMAHIGPDGKLASYEQVLTNEKFASIKVDAATKADVLRTVGHPAEYSRVGFHDYEVWSYRYRESGVWNSMMHVHFDQAGVVRQMLNGPDPRYQDHDRDFW